MQQLAIEFFYPLTEQIPLDLDYTDCAKPSISVPLVNSSSYLISTNGPAAWATNSGGHLTLDIETTKIKVKEEPGLCRKMLYKCMGLQWEKK